MNNINAYHAYQSTLPATSAASTKSSRSASAAKDTQTVEKKPQTTKSTETEKTGQTSSPVLSDKAKALLQELKKNYGNMDFIVADYSSDEEAQSYLSRGIKEYTVLIDPTELERMAEDDEVKTKNLALLDEAVGNLDALKEQLKDSENEDSVVHLGVTIGSDGSVSYFADLEKIGERQKEFVDKIREKKQAEKDTAEKNASEKTASDKNTDTSAAYEKVRKTTVTASSIEELLDKINHVDWDQIPEETLLPQTTGSRFDFSV